MSKHCPKCGRASSSTIFLEDFCLEHGLEKKFSSFSCPKIKLFYCTGCKKIKIFSKEEEKVFWVEKESKEFFTFLFSKLKIFSGLKVEEPKLINNFFHFKIENFFYSLPLKLNFIATFCKNCKQKSTRGYKAIIQLRGKKEKIQAFKIFLFKNFSLYNIFVMKEKELKEGQNLFVSEKEKLAKFFSDNKIKYLRTTKLVGQKKDGTRIYLDTFLIRL